ncbi:MAG TPA: SLBB domain-containing protein, partial [Candidatus Marinimicrobia bacterium]|nr:SLBB domain-containing protein [Candidatus Neomarinimicrobiota bacterium]
MKKVIFLMILASSLLIGQSTQELMKMAKKAGINTEAQARSLARQRGLTIKDDQVADTLENIIQGVIQDGPVVEEGFETLIDTVTEGQLAAQPLQYFGYDIFQGDPGVFQSSTFGAVDPDYNIGPGDEVIIMLWGETQFRQVFTVNREGFIFLPEVGQVFVNSITLGELERKLFRLLSKVYSSINPSSGKASTFMDVSLGNLRPLRIIVLGEVSQPGAYSVSTSTSLFTALYYFRGPTTLGSLRDIRLIRDGKQVASVDFYDYLLSGKQLNDVRLQLDDVIFIPPRGKTVTIRGAVKRNAIFELKEKESIKDLVEMAGGLEMTAYLERAQVDRVVPFEERTDEWKDRVISDFNIGDEITGETLMQLEDADNIQVFSILDIHQNTVYLSGSSVVRPGRYELKNGMRIRELVEKAGGLLNDAYLGAAHLVRTREENLQKQLISFHLDGAMEGDSVNNLELQWNDSLIIYNKNTITNAFKTVSINGSVKTPGEYSFFPGMNLGDLFLDAGGFPLNVMRAKVEIASIDPMNLNPKLYSKTRQILFNREGGQTEFFSMDDLLNKIN